MPIKLKILKIYIKINFNNSFIKFFISLASILILFIYRKYSNFCFYIDY